MHTEQVFAQGFIKRAMEYGYSEEQAFGIYKQAGKLNARDIEKHLGMYIRDPKDHETISKGIDDAYADSFSLRHPYLTGIPTLGLAPSIAKENAKRKIVDDLFRSNPQLHQQHEDRLSREDEQRHRREVELMQKHIAEREAQAREKITGMGAATLLSALNSYNQRGQQQDRRNDFDI